MATRTEVLQQLGCVRGRIRCIHTDSERCPAQVSKGFLRTINELQTQLAKLRGEYYRREELVTEYELVVAKHSGELKALLGDNGRNLLRLKRMLALVRQVNRLDRNAKLTTRLHEAQLTSQKVTDLKMFIAGFRNEIKRLEGITEAKFLEHEELIVRAIDANLRYWAAFIDNRRRKDDLLSELYAQADQLERVAANMRDDGDVQRLQALLESAKQLTEELRAEGVEI
jgi:hypothetical protein